MQRRPSGFQTIRSEGGLLPPDLLRRVLEPKEKLEGTQPEDYGLPQGERLNELITQSWNRLRKHWREFRSAATNLPDGEAGTGITNEKWNLPVLRELGFGLLPTSAGPAINGRTYAINRFFGPVPVHLIGSSLSLDHRAAGVRGAAVNPHGLVQEFLNRSSSHLWAILSNGLRFRILRRNQALSRQSFVEFDLEAMFAGEVYSDFVLLWLTSHATRFAPRDGDRPEDCWLERWTKIADEQGTRVLGDLRGGVERALLILGEGFTAHPRNLDLRDGLRSGTLPLVEFHGQLLRVVYRLIFLFVAEDRTIDGQSLLHPRDASEAARLARERYTSHYSTARFRDLASNIKGSRHADLWRQFQLVVAPLSGDAGSAAAREQLALPALGSFLWDPGSTSAVNTAELTNHDFLEALRHLAFTRQGKTLRPVDYKNLGAEELGGVYESLLALTPQLSADGARFTFAEFAGSERKTSGSYYTPDSLVRCLLDSALDPVVEDAINNKTGQEAEKAILALKICDPAVGSGHFLVGAAHRLARHLARARALARGESEPSPLLYQHALRDVIGRCLYGVDVNPMAAELCRVSLWLEALEPGKPLSFLDHHIRIGNSLLGATPKLIAAGIPDEAFTAIEGDDKKACAALKKRNKAQRSHPTGPLFAQQDAENQNRLERAAAALEELPDDRPEEIRVKELAFRRHEQTQEYIQKKQLADAWCAAFVIRKRFSEPGRESSAVGIIQGHLNSLAEGRPLPAEVDTELNFLSGQYQFFHWHLAFPEVLGKGGFDCVFGNPPWDKIQPEEEKFFAAIRSDIANAASAKIRKELIARLPVDDPLNHVRWVEHQRRIDGLSQFLKCSGALRFTGEGNLNSYRVFTELSAALLSPKGRAGLVVQTGLATDESGKELFDYLLSTKRLLRFLDFENRQVFFTDVHQQFRFSLITLGGSETLNARGAAEFGWLLHSLEELKAPNRLVQLSASDLVLFNPSSRTCPVFTSIRDFAVSKIIYHRGHHICIDDHNRLGKVDFLGELFNMTRDVGHFAAEPTDTSLPLYEAKYIHQFDHRFATSSNGDVRELAAGERAKPDRLVTPRSWVEKDLVYSRASKRGMHLRWMAGFRSIASPTNERTSILAVLPFAGVGNSINLILGLTAVETAFLVANANAFVFDFCARQKISGSNVNIWIFKQLPAISLARYSEICPWSGGAQTLREWVLSRVLELTYTAWDLEPFAQDCSCSGPPYRWNEERRFLLRCELDAAFFHLYLPTQANGDWFPIEGQTEEDLARLKENFQSPRDAVDYVMETFPIVKRKDIEKHGDYRTKLVVLDVYERMQRSMVSGQPYQTLLNPPPADPHVAHPPRKGER